MSIHSYVFSDEHVFADVELIEDNKEPVDLFRRDKHGDSYLATLTRTDIIALAKHFGLTAEDLA